jgi:hypothetical protein
MIRFAEEPMNDQENDERSNKEHGVRIPDKPIKNSFSPRGSHILFNGHNPDISHSPTIQVSDTFVMSGMSPTPLAEGGERQYTADVTEDRVSPLRGKEGAVAAIVEEDEDAYLESGGRYG